MDNNYSNSDYFDDLLKEMEKIAVHVDAAKQLIETRKNLVKEDTKVKEPEALSTPEVVATPQTVAPEAVTAPPVAEPEAVVPPTNNRMDNIFEDLGFTVPTQNNVAPSVPAAPVEPEEPKPEIGVPNVTAGLEVPTPAPTVVAPVTAPAPNPAPIEGPVPEMKSEELPTVPSFGGVPPIGNNEETPVVSPLYGNVEPIGTSPEQVVSPYQGSSLFGSGQPTEVREDAPIAPVQSNPLFGTDVPVANPSASITR